jgi:hypothetical protein
MLMWKLRLVAQKADESFETLSVVTLLHAAYHYTRPKLRHYAMPFYVAHCVACTALIWTIKAVFCEARKYTSYC